MEAWALRFAIGCVVFIIAVIVGWLIVRYKED